MQKCVLKTSSDSRWHYVEGVVYQPLAIDTDWETMTADDVQKMAHDFIASGKVEAIDTQHNRQTSGAEVVESFIARKGDPDYPEGSWVLKCRMEDGPLWESIKSGELNGYSFDAFVSKVPKQVVVDMVKVASGDSEDNTDTSEVPAHKHEYYVEFDSKGRVVVGVTDEVLGHTHRISGTVVTDEADGHTHRFFVE